MIFKPQQLISVYYNSKDTRLIMGRLLLKERKLFFEYDSEFIKTGLELSPFKLPLKSGVVAMEDRIFEGLFGVFNDSLPDGWGRLLLDRKLMQMGLNPGNLSPLDRLCFVGHNGMGALSYEPENPNHSGLIHEDLDKIYAEIQSFQDDNDDRFVDDLLVLGGSSAGARPKILIRIQDEDWLVKFRSSVDPKDISAIEYAYHLMAKDSGLDVPEAKLFPSRNKEYGYFGVKRFDRCQDEHIHMHTICGLLHADHREPCLDYEIIMKATAFLTRDMRQNEKQFRNAVFNVLSHNRDDHSKNFSYLMDEKGVWTVAPAYDLTFSSGPGGEHSTMVMGEGKNPKLAHLLKLANISNIQKSQALEIIDQVVASVNQWENFAVLAGVSKSSSKMIKSSLNNINIFT